MLSCVVCVAKVSDPVAVRPSCMDLPGRGSNFVAAGGGGDGSDGGDIGDGRP
jgi:hypothetical protein